MISFINPLHSRDHRQVAPSTPSPSSTSPPKSSPHSHSLSRQQQQQQHHQFYQTKDQLHPDQRDNKPKYYSIFSELTTQVDQRERALQQFPCEERHSYNPHYQHNLVSSPSSPSLCPSSAGSSPSSAYSSNSSSSSLSRAAGGRVLTQEQSNKQQQDHHYYRHYNRRQNQRHYAYQQQNEHYYDDWMFGISEDDSYNGGASMTCAQPQDPLVFVASSSSKTPSLNGSLRSSISRKERLQVSDGSLSVATQISAKNRRPTVTFSPVVLHHPAPGQEFTALLSSSFASSSQTSSAPAKLLPSIAESSMGLNSSMAMATAKAESTKVVQQQQPASAGRITAKQSLMRIAQLSKDQDGWCPHKAGQYTQGYAEARSRGMKLDGRRARRL